MITTSLQKSNHVKSWIDPQISNYEGSYALIRGYFGYLSLDLLGRNKEAIKKDLSSANAKRKALPLQRRKAKIEF